VEEGARQKEGKNRSFSGRRSGGPRNCFLAKKCDCKCTNCNMSALAIALLRRARQKCVSNQNVLLYVCMFLCVYLDFCRMC